MKEKERVMKTENALRIQFPVTCIGSAETDLSLIIFLPGHAGASRLQLAADL